jgi:hypothetical protein
MRWPVRRRLRRIRMKPTPLLGDRVQASVRRCLILATAARQAGETLNRRVAQVARNARVCSKNWPKAGSVSRKR